MKDKVTSFETFVRLPWVSWAAPRAVRSDMSGPTLLGVAAASFTGGEGKQRVLEPSGGETLPDGGGGPDRRRRREAGRGRALPARLSRTVRPARLSGARS